MFMVLHNLMYSMGGGLKFIDMKHLSTGVAFSNGLY